MGLIQSAEDLKRKDWGPQRNREFCQLIAFRLKLQHQLFPRSLLPAYPADFGLLSASLSLFNNNMYICISGSVSLENSENYNHPPRSLLPSFTHAVSHQMTWSFISHRHRCCEIQRTFFSFFLFDFPVAFNTTLLSWNTHVWTSKILQNPDFPPPSLEPLLTVLCSSFLLRAILLDAGILLGSVLSPLFAEPTLSPRDFIHKHSFNYLLCNCWLQPRFLWGLDSCSQLSSDSSTWILKCCNFILSDQKTSFLWGEGSSHPKEAAG